MKQTNQPPIQRRAFLRAAGISLALPLFESMPSLAANTNPRSSTSPMRMVCIGNEFGMHPASFWPKDSGPNYTLSPLLRPIAKHRKEFTVFSHLDHGLKGGHFAIHSFLTSVKAADAGQLPEGGISLDQRAAEFVGAETRYPSLNIGSESGLHGGPQMSWTRTGTRVPPIEGPKQLFNTLFADESSTNKSKQLNRYSLQNSILDAVLGDAKSMQRKLSATDTEKLDEYFNAVREVEKQLQLKRKWQHVAKPKTDRELPQNHGLVKDLPLLYDLIALALQTDSTRIATLEIGGGFAASDLGIQKGYHALSHHGKLAGNIKTLVEIERYQMAEFGKFLSKMKELRDPNTDQSLLDKTMVMMGSGMGNANAHTNHDLPILLAGGGFRHGEFKVMPKEKNKRIPLSNLYLSMLQRFGVETDFFGMSTGTLTGLEIG